MKRIRKRLPALLLAILLCLNLLPGTVLAANATTVKVGSVELNSTTAYAVTDNGTVTTEGASDSNWNIKFENGTLTLKGATIATAYTDDNTSKTYGIYADGDLTLELVGTSTVQSADTAFNYGVYINGSLTVSGTGSLTAGGTDYGVYVSQDIAANSGSITGSISDSSSTKTSYGIYAGNALTVSGGTVKGTSSTANGKGIYVYGDISVTSGNVEGTATGGGTQFGEYPTGLWVRGTVTVSGSGSVAGTANDKLGYGICVEQGDLTVSDSGNVTGTASGSSSTGIYVKTGNTTVDGGSVTGTASGSSGNGISVRLLEVKSGSVTGTNNGSSNNYGTGIGASTMTVTGGTVTGTSATKYGNGISVSFRDLTISGGTVSGTANGEYGYGISAESNIIITGSPTVTATSATEGNAVKIKHLNNFLVNDTRYEPSAIATTFEVKNGVVTGAESWRPEIWVNGERIPTAPDCTVACGSGKAVYDLDTNTLTLTNATISAEHEINVSGGNVFTTCGIYAESDLTLVLAGSSTVESDTPFNHGVYIAGALTVRGSGGTLTAKASDGEGIFAKSMTVESGTVEGISSGTKGGTGVGVRDTLTMKGGSVTGTSSGSNGYGIGVGNALTVESGSVTGTGTGSSSYGIDVQKDALTVSGGSVTGTGKEAGVYLEKSALKVSGGTVTGEGTNYGIYVPMGTLTVSDSGSVSGTADGKQGDGIYTKYSLTVNGGDVTGTATGENGWGINVDASGLTVNGGSVTGNGDSTGIYADSGLTVSAGTVTGTGTGEDSWGIDAALLNMTGGIVTGEGSNAAIVAYDKGELAAGNLISVPANYVPNGYQVKTVAVENNSGVTYTYASFAEPGKTLAYDSETGTFTDAAKEITLKAPGAISFPQQFYASINFADDTGYKSFGHVTKSGNEWMIYKETGDVAGRTIYGMESAGGAIFTVESDNDKEWMLRVYSSDLATSRTIGKITNQAGTMNYAIVDTAMDLSGTEPVLYGTYQALGLVGGQPAYCSYICKISLTDGTTSDYLQIGGDLPGTDIIYAIAFDENGKLYAIGADAGDDGGPASLYTIDLSSGAATLVGKIKGSSGGTISTNYVQDLAYDYNTKTLYWMENKGNVLYTVDAGTAVATKVGQVRFEKDISLKTYSLSSFCILDDTPTTSGGKHMVSVIHDENITVTEQNGSTAADAVYMLGDGESLTLNITPDSKLGLWYVKVDGEKVDIENPMDSTSYTFNNVTADHVIEVVSRIPINIEESKWNWDSYKGKTASYYTQHSVYKFYDLPDRFESDFDAPEEGYTQTLLDEEGHPIGDNERILVGNKYNVRVTHPGTEKYAPLNVTYKDVLNLEKCKEPPGRPVVYGKVGCKQSDLATTSYLQDYYRDDGILYGTQIYDQIPVTLVWLDPDTTYNQEGYFFARATIYAAEDLDESLAQYYDVDNGGSLEPGCQIDPDNRLRSTQVVVLGENEASLIKLQASDASGGAVSGKGVYKNGDRVTVTAAVNENAGYEFKGWQENGTTVSTDATYTFKANGDRTLTALFEINEDYRVTLKTDPQDAGTVTGGGSYEDGSHEATVEATAKPGYYFIGWYKDGQTEAVSTDAEYTFTVEEDGVTLTAKFGIDYLARAEQAKANLASALGKDTFEWQTLAQAVDAYKAAADFVENPPSVIQDAGERYDALTAYYSGIEALDLSGQGIGDADLAKLELFTGVTELNLSGNKDVTSLTALKDLTQLETLDISDTGVTTADVLVSGDALAFPGLKTLTAQNLSLTSLSALAKAAGADGFNTDAVTKWDFTGSTLTDTEDNKADVAAIQEKLGEEKFLPPTPVNPGGGGVITYAVTVEDAENGKVTRSPARAGRGTTVTITTAPDDGYELDKLTVTDARGSELELTDKGNGKYTFRMPASKVTVEAVFTEILPESLPFIDVDEDAWYADAVRYVYEHDLMAGYGGDLFGPNDELSRAQFCQIIYNMEDQPTVTSSSAFTDVADGAWYANAVTWAAENGIVGGYGGGLFGPEDNITREQFAAILYRYAQAKGYGTTASFDLSAYGDVSDVSAWAISAMQWACGKDIINGTSPTTLAPQGTATRAQAATMLQRFCEQYSQNEG